MNNIAFIAEKRELQFFNGKALINLVFEFVYDDEDGTEQDFGFEGYASAYFRVYDEREGQLLKNFTTQITQTGKYLYFNCSVLDMTFEDLGPYEFELGYNRTGYETVLRYGPLKIV